MLCAELGKWGLVELVQGEVVRARGVFVCFKLLRCSIFEAVSIDHKEGNGVGLVIGLVLSHSLTGPVISENDNGMFHEILSSAQMTTHSLAT